MKNNFTLIYAALCALLAPGLTATGWAGGSMSGAADIGYIKYNAEVDGKEVFSGNTLVQNYSIDYRATNLLYRNQPRYYKLMLGYDWMSFNTSTSDQKQDRNIKESLGKIRYSGDVGYAGAELPIKVRAYINDDNIPTFKYSNGTGLINDGLISSLQGRGTHVSSGVTFAFEPRAARNVFLYGLPRLLLDYRQTVNKNMEDSFKIHNRTRELAVAGLNQENNWINFRKFTYENFLDANDQFTRQQVQIGLVDHRGRRLWSSLTNWIEASVDGQLTEVRSPAVEAVRDEYDVNLMLTASRKLWSARSFMNYNRDLSADVLTETARVPIYVRGLYGTDTDWYVSLSAFRSRQKNANQLSFKTSATNSIAAGGTTFKRSSFTLSSAVNLQTTKSYDGLDSYSFDTSLETLSTRRFSDKVDLAGKITFRANDNGNNSAQSKTWSTTIDGKASYIPNSRFNYSLAERLESGSGDAYLDLARFHNGATATGSVGTYLRNYLYASASWVPNSRFSTLLNASYDIIKVTDLRPSTASTLNYQVGYGEQGASARFNSRYTRSDNGYDTASFIWINTAEVQYQPDRYNDGLLRLNHERESAANIDSARLAVLQRYSYNLFSRLGQIRNIGTLSEEYSYTSEESFGRKGSSQYLMFSGRYSPTERLSLYGSAKYETSSAGSPVLYYTAGLNTDFKLLSASLDYAYARRNSDNRQEKRLSANVRREF